MKKFGLFAFLGALMLGVVACNDATSSSAGSNSSSTGTPTSSSSVSSEQSTSSSTNNESSSTSSSVVSVNLPAAWDEGDTYQAKECSISLVPGSIENDDALSLQNFLHLEGARYIDLRDVSEGYGVGHIAGFESISYFRVIVGDGLLFTSTDDGFVANYEESEAVLNNLFPKDLTYFVMCQVGGRVTPFLKLLAQYGYNMENIYNVGGWNQIKDVKDENNKNTYAGYDVALGLKADATTYDFSDLTPVTASAQAARKYAQKASETDLPAAWDEGDSYQAKECSISLVPGSIENDSAESLQNYLNLEGARYIDLRDVSEGYGVGHIAGFETISYFKVIVGDGLLFTSTDDGFVANYEESEAVLNNLFPKDLTYFVMCQVGGRVTPFLKLLAQYGYNMENIYNVGGWNQIKDVKDENNKNTYADYSVSLGLKADATTYDFSDLTSVA